MVVQQVAQLSEQKDWSLETEKRFEQHKNQNSEEEKNLNDIHSSPYKNPNHVLPIENKIRRYRSSHRR